MPKETRVKNTLYYSGKLKSLQLRWPRQSCELRYFDFSASFSSPRTPGRIPLPGKKASWTIPFDRERQGSRGAKH